MITIRVEYKKVGNYNIMYTTAWGFELSVISQIKPDRNNNITYDPHKANILINPKGYIYLSILQ